MAQEQQQQAEVVFNSHPLIASLRRANKVKRDLTYSPYRNTTSGQVQLHDANIIITAMLQLCN